MLFQIQCDACKSKINIKDERHIGRKVPCPKCKQPLMIQRHVQEEEPVELLEVKEIPAESDPLNVNLFNEDFGGYLPSTDAVAMPAGNQGSNFWNPVATTSADTSETKVSSKSGSSPSNMLSILVGVGGAVALFTLFGILYFLLFSIPSTKDSKTNTLASDVAGIANENVESLLKPKVSALDDFDTTEQRVRKIAKAWENYEDTFRRYPNFNGRHNPDASANAEAKPELSWRVELLPFLGKEDLYKKFNLKEPWNSPTNLALINEMPDVFQSPGVNKPGFTSMHVFTGEKTLFHEPTSTVRRDITDGGASTFMFVVAGSDKASEWTKPSSIPFDKSTSIDAMGKPPFPQGFLAAYFSYEVVVIPKDIPLEVFQAMVTSQGKERIQPLATIEATKEQLKRLIRYKSIFEMGPDSEDPKSIVYFGFKKKHRRVLEEFLKSPIVKKRLPELSEDKIPESINLFVESLKKTADELELKPEENGNYNFPDDEDFLNAMEEEVKALKVKPFVDPFNIKLAPLSELMLEARVEGKSSHEYDYCILLQRAITVLSELR